MGNLRTFIPILISIIIAIGGSFFLYQWVKKKTAPEQSVMVKESKAIPVVTAKANIPWGTKLNEEMMAVRPYLEESLPKGCFQKPADVVNRILVSQIMEGEPIVEHRLAPTSLETGGVAAVLSPGSRAVSVKGNRVLGLAGFINPGNRVDVLVTIDDPETKAPATKTVLENLLVLASGTQIVENSKGEPAPVDVYTLEVTPEQGERITLAATEGQLQFAMRGAADAEIILTGGITIPKLLKSLLLSGEEKMVPAMPAKEEAGPVIGETHRQYVRPAVKSRKVTIELIKGLEITREEVAISNKN